MHMNGLDYENEQASKNYAFGNKNGIQSETPAL